MELLVIVLFVVSTLLVVYIIWLQNQFRSINCQLAKRLTEKTRQPIRLELINSELNRLASHINECLKSEETLRLESTREERRFKELIANISHDLRTPLTAIKGYQQLMAKGGLTAKQQEKLQVAQKHADELGILIEHFFEYSYLVSAESEFSPSRINVTNLVMECLATEVPTFEERGLTVHFQEAPQVFVIADYEMTMRIMHNLIRNCVTHAAGDLTVNVSMGESVVVSFKNLLENAAEIDVDRLFDRFYTGDRARRKSTGLGLSIVKLLTEKMGGRVGAELQEDMIEIWVALPLYK
ncbi:signal transduction histidine kinase [Paenibacillus sp. DS2015]|uniref:sensor histidine kinase n=1 Tax=Paenibacillus sp. DS2015 TaxID=3373917 RepID=UPI003D1B3194